MQQLLQKHILKELPSYPARTIGIFLILDSDVLDRINVGCRWVPIHQWIIDKLVKIRKVYIVSRRSRPSAPQGIIRPS